MTVKCVLTVMYMVPSLDGVIQKRFTHEYKFDNSPTTFLQTLREEVENGR